jgi:hypothetical protein
MQMPYRQTRNAYDNQNIMIFEGIGEYDFPYVHREEIVPPKFYRV